MDQLHHISTCAAETPPTAYCVWMDAGVMNYKLCDRAFDCDRCPLDQALHRRRSESRNVNVKSEHSETIWKDGR
ncbi:MAG TPA: hypothetical protein VE863_21970 [Pyrinomonadaceae bacterium]|jgi:hypothetical protein|nr:hypothetical protein [Pyrinomonadaceae bacterium]